jgi:hypothetical protein
MIGLAGVIVLGAHAWTQYGGDIERARELATAAAETAAKYGSALLAKRAQRLLAEM